MKNKSPKATEKLLARAKELCLKAEIIENSRGHYRRHSPLGSTSVPQKVITIDGIRFSVGGAKQYLTAKEKEIPTQSFQEVLEEEEGRLRQKDLRQHEMYQDEDLNYSGNR